MEIGWDELLNLPDYAEDETPLFVPVPTICDVSKITDQLSTSPFLSSESKRNMKESMLLADEKQQIESLKDRLQILRTRHHARMCTASLRLHGSTDVWRAIPEHKRFSKENIIAMLSCVLNKGKLPPEFTEKIWCSVRPSPIRAWKNDVDVFLARAARTEFSAYHQAQTFLPCRFLEWLPTESGACLLALVQAAPRTFLHYPLVQLQAFRQQRVEIAHAFFKGCDALYAEKGMLLCTYKMLNDFKLMEAASAKSYTIIPDISENLRDDIDFALSFARNAAEDERPHFSKIHESLQHFSVRVRSNHKVAKTFVSRWGKSYRYVHKSLKQDDLKLAKLACLGDSTAILYYIPGNLEQKLVCDKKLVLRLMSNTDCWLGSAFWCVVSPTLKYDFDVCASAVAHRYISPQDLPHTLTLNEDFWRQALQQNIDLWTEELPQPFASDPTLIQHLSPSNSILENCVGRFPYLRFEKSFWLSVVSHWAGGDTLLSDTMERLADLSLFQDNELATKACSVDPLVLKLLPKDCVLDDSFLSFSGKRIGSSFLGSLDRNTRRLHPGLCAMAILRCHDISAAPKILELDEWQDPQVAHAWFSRGGSWTPDGEHSVFPTRFLSDEGLMLSAAGAGRSADHIFQRVPTSLRRKKTFMLQVLEKDPTLYSAVDVPLKGDFDVLLRAFAGDDPGLVAKSTIFKSWAARNNLALIGFSARVRQLVNNKQLFSEVLYGMSSFSNSSLRALENGAETSIALKRSLAEFLDVPIGPHRKYLQSAHENLTRLGI